jgi:hypothetical protein
MRPPVIHEASALVDGVQRCVRCGVILTDYREAMVLESDRPLRGWPAGAFIEVAAGGPGVPTFSSTTEDAPTCEVSEF